MARLSIIVVIVYGIALMCIYAQEEHYLDKFDDIDVTSILNNETLRLQYRACFYQTGPCPTEAAKYLIGIFSEALQTNCKKCNEKQKIIMDKVIDWYTKNKPDEWQAIVAKTIEDMKKKNAGQ